MDGTCRRGLAAELTLDGLVDLNEALDLDAALGSPLALLSPNALRARPSRSPAAAKHDGLGQLPSFGSPARRRRPDPRRQSAALFAGFAKATAGEGLLGEDEIAVGDEDIVLSLPAAAKSQMARQTTHSTLWLEPHTEELLSGDLPEPEFCSGGECSGLAPIPESPSTTDLEFCSSPMPSVSPRLRGGSRPGSQAGSRAGSRGPSPQKLAGGVRDSTTLSEGLSKMCLEVGFDDWDTDDFQLQEGNKVKEMAFLFKTNDSVQDKSPVASPKQHAEEKGAVSAFNAAGHSGVDIMARVHQLRGAAKPAQAQDQDQNAVTSPTKRPTSKQLEPGSTNSSSRLSGRATASSAAPPAPAPRASRLRPPSTSSSYFSHSAIEARPSASAAPQQGARLPSAGMASSSAAAAAARLPQRPASLLQAAGAASNNITSHASPASQTVLSRLNAGSGPLLSSSALSRPPMTASPGGAASTTSSTTARLQSVRQRLAQPGCSETASSGSAAQPAVPSRGVPTTDQPPRGMFNQRTLGAAASRLRQPTAPSTPTCVAGQEQPRGISGASASKLPMLRVGSPVRKLAGISLAGPLRCRASFPGNLTPNTARIRFLEQHPELAFGGGSKIGNSPAGQQRPQQQPVRRKTAEERHLEEWGNHL